MNKMVCSNLHPWLEIYGELFGVPHCEHLGDIMAKQEFPQYMFILYLEGVEELPEVKRLGAGMGLPESAILAPGTRFILDRVETPINCSECGLAGYIVSVTSPLYPVELILLTTMRKWLARKLSSTTGELVDIAV